MNSTLGSVVPLAMFALVAMLAEQMWTQIDQENGASEKFYMVLIAMQFGTICGKKFQIKSFLQPFRRRESSSFANILFPQSLV